ncbi:MAG: NAD(P)/FAD-dependent oxidoreductase, partial [Clostridia bacterium]|nr:NAD(P)/FAD-dependent oxidoreductase [Clostridia bacterium]
ISKKQTGELFRLLKVSVYDVCGLKGFDHAQLTSGGIKATELSPSLGIKKIKGLYACGEMIDVNGFCGGYNLQWAWSSGYTAGRNCVLENF